MKKRLYSIFISILINIVPMWAQSPFQVEAHIDSTKMWIGNQTELRFEITQPRDFRVDYPIFSDTVVGALEIVENLRLDTFPIENEDKMRVNLRYVVTSFEDSLIYIPSYNFVSKEDTVKSNALSLKVIQPFVIDTTARQMADIKPIYTPPFDWKALLQKIVLGLLLLAVVVLLYFAYKRFVRKEKTEEVVVPEKTIPPYDEVITTLNRIKEEKLWQRSKVKQYHTQLTDALRTYLERRYEVNCMEMTSHEILEHTQEIESTSAMAYNNLREILELGDLVKFAKWRPSMVENETSLEKAYQFVEAIREKDEIDDSNVTEA